MPEMDGIETLGHIRSMGGKFETLPVIALTANVMTWARERYINAGFTDFLEKPIKPSKLDEMLFAYLPKEKLEHKSDDWEPMLQSLPKANFAPQIESFPIT